MSTVADLADLRLLGDTLAADVERSIHDALEVGMVFPAGSDPLSIYRSTLAESIRDIEHHERGQLLQRFLRDGPQIDGEDIPPEVATQRLSDEETATAIAFIFSFMVTSFKGALAELLACGPCARLMNDLVAKGHLSNTSRLYLGDSVLALKTRGAGYGKAADLHLLNIERIEEKIQALTVEGVVEVKSYAVSQPRIRSQLNRHLQRASLGLRVEEAEVATEKIRLGQKNTSPALRIAVVPSRWKLPRTPEYVELEGHNVIQIEDPCPLDEDRVNRIAESEWRIVLRWSQEALASAAYDMTFWYMEKVGEVIYRDGVPPEWSKMTPAEAGRNAVKMMLYYAIRRGRTAREDERAIALYNAYGFGYALGTSFRRSRNGRREMLWPEHIDEVAKNGQTKEGFKFW